MYSDPVFEGDNPENFAPKLLNTAPEAVTVSFLWFGSNWVLQHLNTPFLLKIGSFAQNFILKIPGELVICHAVDKTCPSIPYKMTQMSADRSVNEDNLRKSQDQPWPLE